MRRSFILIFFIAVLGIALSTTIKIALRSDCFALLRDVGVLNELEKRLSDLNLVFIPYSGDPYDALKDLGNGKVSAVLWYGTTPFGFKYGLPLISLDYSLVKYGEDVKFVGTTRELLEIVKYFLPQTTLVVFNDPDDMLKSMNDGDVDAVFYVKPFLLEHGLDEENMLEVKGIRAFCRFVFSNKVPDEVVNEVNRAILSLYKSDALKYENMKGVHKPNIIKLAVIEWPPYEYKDGDEWVGTDVDVVKRVFSKLGYDVKLVSYPLIRAFRFLAGGLVDGAFSIEKTPDREEILSYVDTPLSSGHDVFFINKKLASDLFSYPEVDGFDPDALGKRICGYVKGYANKDMLKKYCSEIIPVQNDMIGILLVLRNRIDMFMTNFLVGRYFSKVLKASDEIVASKAVRGYYSYLALSKKSPHIPLLPFLEREIENFKKSANYTEILKKYNAVLTGR